MRVVPLEAFRDRVSFAVAIGAVERGFRALGLGEATLPDPLVLELRDQQAEVHVKGAHLRGGRHIVLKLATGFYRNRARGLPSGDGMFLLLDAETGVPDLLLEEHGYLTDFRTAAAVALTLKYLAPRGAGEALLVGAGALARLTARAMIAELPLERLTLWNRSPERADALARELAPFVQTHVAPTPSLEQAVRDDRVSQTERYGNLHHALAAGAVGRDKVYGELGDLAAGRLAGRESASEITVADLTGVGVQDAAIAQAVVEALGL